jgi:biopolymer transport protein ExbB/TolQ
MFYYLQQAIEIGGFSVVLLIIFTVILWFSFLERSFYLFVYADKDLKDSLSLYSNSKMFKRSALKFIENEIISSYKLALTKNLTVIRSITLVSPLCGLLGTVSGMVVIFSDFSEAQSGSISIFAGGIARATFSTVVGIFIALLALLFETLLRRICQKKINFLVDNLL